MTTGLITPLDLSDATKVGRRTFRKQLLKKESIDYKGHKVHFDDAFMLDLAKAFNDGAYDQVPIQFATPDNEHNEDPKNFGGELKGIELTADGLDGIIEFTDEGAAAIEKNPRLGVSARIRQGLEKADGRKFPRAIRHVLLTMDPRVSGLKPWEALDLSDDKNDTEVVDLTAANMKEDIVGDKATVDKDKKKITTADGAVLDLAELSDESFQALLDLSAAAIEDGVDEDIVDDPPKPDVKPEEGVVFEEDGKKYVILNGEKMLLTPSAPLVAPKPDEDTDLSDEVKTWRAERKQERWDADKAKFLAAGVPAFMVDLAEPVLLAEPQTIDLTAEDGKTSKTDAGEVVRNILNGAAGWIDLNPEAGHQIDLSVVDDEDPDKPMLDAWTEQYG